MSWRFDAKWYELKEDKLDGVAYGCEGMTGRSHMEYAYEAGADAYEAALKERGKKVTVTDTVRDNLYGEDRLVSEKVQTGWQVFIPEEEQL